MQSPALVFPPQKVASSMTPGRCFRRPAEMIHGHPRFQSIPIVFISGIHMTDLDRLKGYQHGWGFWAIVTKDRANITKLCDRLSELTIQLHESHDSVHQRKVLDQMRLLLCEP